ncbi:accessory factor UbiK family protein, partial [Castellaniella sp.]|uniref:accessory factor UbiK family protein n=1 Tax=Castellaniella sp. TaxID=1955812 RepID=UPI00356665D0
MDLITREEFDIQAGLLARALERLGQLEARVQALEARGAGVAAGSDPDSAGPGPAAVDSDAS